MREEIVKLIQLGSFPNETSAAPEVVDHYAELINMVSPPVELDEAKSLITLFGTDTFFGLAWTLVHLIETCPDWSADALVNVNENMWINILKERLQAR